MSPTIPTPKNINTPSLRVAWRVALAFLIDPDLDMVRPINPVRQLVMVQANANGCGVSIEDVEHIATQIAAGGAEAPAAEIRNSAAKGRVAIVIHDTPAGRLVLNHLDLGPAVNVAATASA